MLVLARQVGFKPDGTLIDSYVTHVRVLHSRARARVVVVPISAWQARTPCGGDKSLCPMLFDIMEQMANAVTTASGAQQGDGPATRVPTLGLAACGRAVHQRQGWALHKMWLSELKPKLYRLVFEGMESSSLRRDTAQLGQHSHALCKAQHITP
jgi:hypothetical protein